MAVLPQIVALFEVMFAAEMMEHQLKAASLETKRVVGMTKEFVLV